MEERRERSVRRTIFWTLFLTYAYFFQGGGWNQNARFDLTWSIVEEGSLVIGRYGPDGRLEPGSMATNTDDVAYHRGRVYPNKPPGISFLAVPVYAVLYWGEVLVGVHPLGSLALIHFNAYVATVCSMALVSAALGAALFSALGYLRPGPVGPRLWVTAGYSLGTLAFPWATLFQAHQVSAALTFFIFALWLRHEYGSVREAGQPGRAAGLDVDTIAGLLAGLAILVEYNNAAAVAFLLGYRLLGPEPRRGLVRFAAGAAFPVAGLLAYHQACFGSPFATNYTYQNPLFEDSKGGVFRWPPLRVFLELTFLPKRGLFFTSPLLVLAIPGAAAFLSARWGRRLEALACLSIVLFYLSLNAAFIHWEGGWSAGPRYLVPCLPFLAVSLYFFWPRLPALFFGLLSLSVLIQTAVTAVNPSPRFEIENPLFEHTFRHLAANRVSVNTQSLLDRLPPEQEGLPVSPAAAWSSFNLGELAGLPGLLSLLPLLLIWAAAWREVRRIGIQ
ncbi:MAG: hypothetical protein HYU36_03465 [Planctomycetes bacterium]|nr:hypothetical protein [Planctomycetota bacterium]